MISRTVDLAAYRNNTGASVDGTAVAGGLARGESFSAEHLPTGKLVNRGIEFVLPPWAVAPDNVKCDGQTIPVDDEVLSVHLLAAGDDPRGGIHKENKVSITFNYDNGSEDVLPLEIQNWWATNGQQKGAICTPFHWEGRGSKFHERTVIFHMVVQVPYARASQVLKSVTVPKAGKHNALHLFALSYIPATRSVTTLQDKVKPGRVTATRRWEGNAQVVEVVVLNPVSLAAVGDLDSWAKDLTVSLLGSSFKTVRGATISRLMPADQILVEVLVTPTNDSTSFDDAQLAVNDVVLPVYVEGSLVHEFTQWTAADAEQHTAPKWFSDAKFGIFIHWGLYSVPAWADEGKYAEWYWHWQHTADQNGPGTYNHHLKTYGADFTYDDFIPLFQGERFDPRHWVNLFADAGAKYFVFTTKHHDGYALFDAKETTHRTSLLLGPKRDFTRELMDAAQEFQPDLKKGAYYSMPEWYNPLYVKYGRDDGPLSFWGGPAKNAYNGKVEEYTGHVDVGDYICGLQVPQLEILTNDYKVDLIWGDIGMAWYSDAAAAGRQVSINNRLGIAGDYVTPEMEQFKTVQPLWEACMSVDPYSFGYNKETRDDEYRTPTDLIHTLIDIVAKGGNFLLNIGPRADGSIPTAVETILRAIGKWLGINGRALYSTQPFPLVPEIEAPGVNVRITRSSEALYLISLEKPGPRFAIRAPLPILPTDKVFLLGNETPIPATFDGELVLDLSSVDIEPNDIAWVFEIR
ncbi:uncharacterized protein CcaverHIS019_0210210 [Cutaneotrichosporon cavernicola]|uniref:alpha-L-fucosidase n=1 Tax=Cutaneotrichosporon cavernicola TaxID=279322 RepID=A0AA48KYQ8_9TREE|nr:uncharacterized protein CcaverHIS019_0210210 [Cutaneotrichosporon cavernicola]BEI89659.1 hypothetical protein CcaverHIS019_0210210 [Cutaneotrichosporon cavernicola]BEI97430.1 hypothetical protein CcaverHIS631_0210190 [Cutaneotrichosporon cavernicola]BEJ05208.1 hypothetical protein CcaverHIS641_0210250 [Cutaneotrichosporon cavernicola]